MEVIAHCFDDYEHTGNSQKPILVKMECREWSKLKAWERKPVIEENIPDIGETCDFRKVLEFVRDLMPDALAAWVAKLDKAMEYGNLAYNRIKEHVKANT